MKTVYNQFTNYQTPGRFIYQELLPDRPTYPHVLQETSNNLSELQAQIAAQSVHFDASNPNPTVLSPLNRLNDGDKGNLTGLNVRAKVGGNPFATNIGVEVDGSYQVSDNARIGANIEVGKTVNYTKDNATYGRVSGVGEFGKPNAPVQLKVFGDYSTDHVPSDKTIRKNNDQLTIGAQTNIRLDGNNTNSVYIQGLNTNGKNGKYSILDQTTGLPVVESAKNRFTQATAGIAHQTPDGVSWYAGGGVKTYGTKKIVEGATEYWDNGETVTDPTNPNFGLPIIDLVNPVSTKDGIGLQPVVQAGVKIPMQNGKTTLDINAGSDFTAQNTNISVGVIQDFGDKVQGKQPPKKIF